MVLLGLSTGTDDAEEAIGKGDEVQPDSWKESFLKRWRKP
jgi:hypothetical protein